MIRVLKKGMALILVLALCCTVFGTGYVCAKNGFNKKPTSDVGFEANKKTNGKKVKAPSGNYGYKDSKNRVWVPDGKMHGGKGWTREYPDGSHDHVYENGNLRVHSSKSNSASNNWLLVAVGILLLGVTVLSPIPGDEIVVGGALLGL
ncbi:MAG: hypothetical protein E7277_05695 [Lachnospiraceae bacterium]|nr:hypothetical protein [Lachnospiraceae bacterium]SFQ48143.1 hypothetical protein SAMN02910358_02378 [Lachnospiraceae bacterium XBB1006]